MTTEEVVESNQEEQTVSQDAAEVEAVQAEEAVVESTSNETPEAVDEVAVASTEDAPALEATSVPSATSLPSGEEQPEGEQQVKLTDDQKVGLLEALLLASGDPLPISRVEELLACTKDDVLALAESLKESYAAEKRGLELVNVSSKLQLRTKALYAEYVRNLIAVKPRKLSQAALETLAVIAYQQPVVKSEVDKIRGVDVAPTIKTLLERKLVKILGYQASVGQPALYGTTEDFLSIFGLTSLAELPSLRDLKALVKEPGEALEVSESGEASEDVDSLEEGDATPSPSEEQIAENAAPIQ
jgi:segregation and condensation protein B